MSDPTPPQDSKATAVPMKGARPRPTEPIPESVPMVVQSALEPNIIAEAPAVSPPIERLPTTEHDLESCAERVLATLPLLADLIREMAYLNSRVPLWAFLAGHVNAAYERGTLSAPILDPSWPRSFMGVGETGAKMAYVCGWCQKPFMGTRLRQKYCTNECGIEAAKFQAAEEREQAAADLTRRNTEMVARA